MPLDLSAFDLVWFQATPVGAAYPTLTAGDMDFLLPLAHNDLSDVACWCPDLYPSALAIKIALLAQSSGLGQVPDAVPSVVAGQTHEAFVSEDEVFDTRRKYILKPVAPQVAASSLPAQLESIIIRCKPPLRVGAFVARMAAPLAGRFGGCCGNSDPADKAEWNHGGQ